MKIKSILVLSLWVLSSCTKPENQSDSVAAFSAGDPGVASYQSGAPGGGSRAMGKSMSADSMIESAQAPPSSKVESIERKVIKNGSLTLQVNSLDGQAKALEFIKSEADKYSVSFDREEENKWGNMATVNLTARVPGEKFEQYLSAITSGPFRISSKSINVTEVTDQYIDLEIRLENKKQLRDKYLSILKSAKVVKDILAINKSIEEVTSQIESTEGQFRYLKKQISYSTLNIEIRAELPVNMVDQNNFLYDIWRSMISGWQNIRYYFLLIISLWPLIILISVIVLIVKARRKKRNED